MTHSNQKPEMVQQLGQSLFAFNYNIEAIEGGYTYNTLIFDHAPSYEEIINGIVKENYPNGADEAAVRAGIVNPISDKFLSFNSFVENAKKQIKAQLNDEQYINTLEERKAELLNKLTLAIVEVNSIKEAAREVVGSDNVDFMAAVNQAEQIRQGSIYLINQLDTIEKAMSFDIREHTIQDMKDLFIKFIIK